MASEFTGRIDHRLSFVFGSLFVLVLLVGGTSLYLLGSLLLKSESIARESEQVHLVEQVHRTLQHFFSAIQLARFQGRALPDSVRGAYLTQLESLVTLYRAAGGPSQNIEDMRDIIADATRLADRVVGRPGGGIGPAPVVLDGHELELLEGADQSIQALTERITAGHGATEQRQVQQTHQKLRLTIGVNVAFVISGALLLLASQRYFHRAIALPLRRLADRSSDIAKGELYRPMPVTTTDEIGRLSHAFNRMAQQLAEHEERLKELVTVEERQRLARELHDNLAQDLAFLRLKLVEADRSRVQSRSTDTNTLLREMFSIVDGAYQNLREAIFGLQALDLSTPGGLVAALNEYLSDFSAIREIPVELQVSGCGTFALPPQAEAQLIRIIHEALTNIARHAHASKATVKLEKEKDTARITIEDNGQGFVVETASQDALHFGLRSMKDRAEAAGGALIIKSSRGHGTTVTLDLPLEQR